MNPHLNKVVRELRTVDWEFPVSFSGASRILHWYPGTFPPEVPATLLQAFSHNDDIVFDPYAGAGTTGAEAIRFGRRAFLVEGNPIAASSCYALAGLILLKTYRPDLLAPVFEVLEGAFIKARKAVATAMLLALDKWYQREIDRSLDRFMTPSPERFLSQIKLGTPKWALLRPWYGKTTLQHIRRAVTCVVDGQQSSFCKLLGLLAISGVLRASSSQTQSWGHLADNVLPKTLEEKDFFANVVHWLGRARGMVRDLEVMAKTENSSTKRVAVVFHDWSDSHALRNPFKERAALIVTSPPYANAIDYTLSQRLSMYLWGYSDDDLMSMVTREIGARRKRLSNCSEITWSDELALALLEQLRHVDPDGFIALVLPHRDAGRDVGKARLGETLVQHGWHELFHVDRSIRQSRTRQSWTSIKKETIFVFQHA